MTGSATDTYLGLRAFVDELVRCGMTHACTSPGSRSTPIVLSLVRDGRIDAISHMDERCAAFFGVGAAKASGRPVAIACTSGTAVANFAPAVVEAWEARVPLLVLTADRPPELRDVGAGQTIDQVKIYGRAAKWYLEVDDAPATPERLRWLRQLACRAYWTALEGRPGPVHLNFALREPLVLDGELPPDEGGRPGGRPWTTRDARPAAAPDALAAALEGAERPLLVAGRLEDARVGPAVAELAHRLNAPLLADPLSGARRLGAIAHYDAFLRAGDWPHVPDAVIRFGDLPTSKPLRQWLAALDARQVAFDPEGAWHDPAATLDHVVGADPRATVEALAPDALPSGWYDAWHEADQRAREAIGDVLGNEDLSEPAVAAALGANLPGEATLVVASSMPVRDVETFFVTRHTPPRVLANRGANGIDGTVSTAFGVAAAAPGPAVLLVGDVALAYDIGGLASARRPGVELTIVLLNNDGGGIFHFLPVAREGEAFLEHVVTPHGLDFAHAAALYGCRHERPRDLPAFRAALDAAVGSGTTTIIEVRTDREENVALHRRVWEAVRSA